MSAKTVAAFGLFTVSALVAGMFRIGSVDTRPFSQRDVLVNAVLGLLAVACGYWLGRSEPPS